MRPFGCNQVRLPKPPQAAFALGVGEPKECRDALESSSVNLNESHASVGSPQIRKPALLRTSTIVSFAVIANFHLASNAPIRNEQRNRLPFAKVLARTVNLATSLQTLGRHRPEPPREAVMDALDGRRSPARYW